MEKEVIFYQTQDGIEPFKEWLDHLKNDILESRIEISNKLFDIGGIIMNKIKYRTLEEVEVEHFTQHPEKLKSYLTVALEEYQKDGDKKAFLHALSIATRVHGGFSKLSRETGLNRENLYRALSKRSDPKLSTVRRVMSALGFSLTIR